MSPIRFVTLFLAFVSAAFAYTVLSPNQSQGWTNQGQQLLTWKYVSTDRLNFTVVLTNPKANSQQNLAALVDGTLEKVNLNSPSGGWPSGSGFQLNLVQDDNDLNTILAQSTVFTIKDMTSLISASSTTPVLTQTDQVPSATTSSPPITVSTSSASSTFLVQTGLLSLFSLIGFAFA